MEKHFLLAFKLKDDSCFLRFHFLSRLGNLRGCCCCRLRDVTLGMPFGGWLFFLVTREWHALKLLEFWRLRLVLITSSARSFAKLFEFLEDRPDVKAEIASQQSVRWSQRFSERASKPPAKLGVCLYRDDCRPSHLLFDPIKLLL